MSHHSTTPDPEMSDAMRKLFQVDEGGDPMEKSLAEIHEKIAGTFPDGKLTEHDEGALAIGVGLKDGKVVIEFPTPVRWIGLTPDKARLIGELLILRSRGID
jgi:hypothetical protein